MKIFVITQIKLSKYYRKNDVSNCFLKYGWIDENIRDNSN